MLARLVLATIASVLCLLLLLAGASFGGPGLPALLQPSPSGSGGGGGGGGGGEVAINLLNPAPGYDPQLGLPPREPGEADPPKISDRPDGVDSAYHIVAWASGAPQGAVAEAYYQRGSGTEQTIGQMLLVPGTTDTYETHWDIPASLADGPINIRARLFKPTPAGFEEIADDEVAADLQNRDDAHVGQGTTQQTSPQDETVEIVYPTNASPLGFFRAKGGQWAAAIEATASDHASEVSLWYSKTAPGGEAAYTKCANYNAFATDEYTSEPIPFTYGCYLAANDKPSQVTAIAAVPEESDKPDRSDSFNGDPDLSQDAADVHRVTSTYVQDPARMKVDVFTDENNLATGQGRRTTGACLSFMVYVSDHLDRPVESANVDVHLQGPGDSVQFAGENSTTGRNDPQSSPAKDPDKAHPTEGGAPCTNNSDDSIGPQGDHNRPGADDVKHLESSSGTGTANGGDPHEIDSGEFRFHVRSGTAGFSEITAWVDSPAVTEAAAPEADDDLPVATEPSATYTAQWLSAAPRLIIEPLARTQAVGQCARYIIRLRGGAAPIPRANVDVHIKGPSDNLDFCDPGNASATRAPDAGTHDAEDQSESTHPGDPPRVQHTEGETDAEGNLVIGLISPDTGDTTITAWYDGDTDQDDDVPGSDPSLTTTATWSDASGAPRLSFVNPSAYGPSSQNPPVIQNPSSGTTISNKQDKDSLFHIVTRVDSINPVEGVEVLIASTTAGPFTNLGRATQIGTADTYELFSSVDVPDGTYILRAHVLGTNVIADQSVTVNRATAPGDQPANQQAETVDITSPANGQPALFRGKALKITGVTSAGTEGVDLFYTRVGPSVTPQSADWISCGFVQVSGLGTTPQEFSGDCTLAAGDQAVQVSGVAAIAYDCAEPGCDADTIVETTPAGTVRTRNPGQKDTGDAHRVFGVESIPFFSIEPAETAAGLDECQKLTIVVEDQTGEGLRDENVDLHLEGPGPGASFCTPPDGSGSQRTAPDQGGHAADAGDAAVGTHSDTGTKVLHTEGQTLPNGRFVVGVMSDDSGDSRIVGWLDRNGNDVQDGDESTDTSIVHWETGPGGGDGCDIEGTDGPDRLVGTAAAEQICGFGGNDTIRGGGGDDVILGAAGRDTLRGGPGNDVIRGTAGRDNVFGGRGRDRLFGGGGNDTVKGHGSNDALRGNRGNDLLVGGPGRDGCRGGGGRDRLRTCESGSRASRGFAARRHLI